MTLINTRLASNDNMRNMVRILTKQRGGLNICHINAQSLLRKIDEFRYVFEESGMDVICISETWFNNFYTESMISANGYKIFKNDRLRHAGGVAVYIKSNLHCKLICRSEKDESIEHIFIEIAGVVSKVLIGCVYRPNRSIPYGSFVQFLEYLTVHYNDVVIASDFNADILTESDLNNSLLSIGLHIINTMNPTHFTSRSCSLLDIFIVSDASKIMLFDQLSASCFSKHDLIFISYDLKLKVMQEHFSYRDFRHIDTIKLNHLFNSIEWDLIYYLPSADEQLEFFNTNFFWIYDNAVPLRTCRKKNNNGWFNAHIKKQIEIRNQRYERWKKFRTTAFFDDFRKARTNVNKIIRKNKTEYFSYRFHTAISSKRKWETIKEIGIGRNNVSSSNIDPNELNKKFLSSSASIATPKQVSTEIRNNSTTADGFGFSCITPVDVQRCCLAIKSNATGFDEINPKLLKVLLPKLIFFITHLFNTILTTSCFPKCWKHARVIPVPKSGSEYRPISILPYLSKVFERLLYQQINKYLSDNNLISKYQSGFKQKHSCVTALINVSDDIRKCLDDGQITFLTLLDHSKAFDCVDHNILCNKLSNVFNFSATATKLIRSYLYDRTQSVSVGTVTSTPLSVKCGVPQGSILGPLLFCVYINELPSKIKHSNIHIYADDVQLYVSCKLSDVYDCVSKLNEDLKSTHIWAMENGLQLNPRKSKCLIISKRRQIIPTNISVLLGNQNIEIVSSAKNLGVIFNNELTWSTHVNSATGATFAKLRTLYPTQHLTPVYIRELLAKTFILPSLLYGCEIYGSCDALSKTRLNVAFNAVVRYVYGVKKYGRVSGYSKLLFNVSFDDLIVIKKLIFLHKIIYTGEPDYLFRRLQFAHSSRGKKLIATRHRTLISEWNFIVSAERHWNQLHSSLQLTGSAIDFKKKLFLSFC